jgi:ribonuclease BN (tRNA processing enzyme)
MKITLLGTGDSFGSGGRHATSIYVQGNDVGILLDCGPSILPSMKAKNYAATDVDAVFISHFHGDHFGGVPFLFLEYQYRSARRRPLTIAGPPGTSDKIKGLTQILFPGLNSKNPPYELAFCDLDSHRAERVGHAALTPFPVKHFPDDIAYGFHLSMDGRIVVFSGDTAWTDELAKQSEDADLLVCECSSLEPETEFHMSYRDLETRRDAIQAQRVVLTHADEQVIARRSELVFELADDGQEIEL